MRKITFLAFLGIILTSCSVTKSGTAKSMDVVGPGVIHKPVVVDLNVKPEKVEVTTTFNGIESLENAKNNVVRKLLKEQDADVLVEPTFETVTKNGKTELTVKGWPATYNNFRPIEEKDLKLLEVKPSYLQKADTYQPVIQEKKKNTGWLVTLGVVLLGGAVAATLL
ncbi:hypothetical protein [Flavobacterium cyclinae]|uniref:hypothetical protein n=1 Tax=Flavobacterium cyclinae TaxID=2895947 RepID=UPI001E3498C8|nr:hypothetical protein [Flavobacterium cyclinae]UGS21863.1 hypothetical protein LOS86_04350 [Flavobacterium cyclinae]